MSALGRRRDPARLVRADAARRRRSGSPACASLSDPLPEDLLVAGPSALICGRRSISTTPTGSSCSRISAPTPSYAPRARASARPVAGRARARAHPRLAEGVEPRARSGPLEAVEAVAPAHPRRRPGRSHRARSSSTRSRSWPPPTCSGPATASAWRSPALDLPTGVGGATNVEYIPYHVCNARATLHHVYHDTEHPSHLLLPVVPQ